MKKNNKENLITTKRKIAAVTTAFMMAQTIGSYVPFNCTNSVNAIELSNLENTEFNSVKNTELPNPENTESNSAKDTELSNPENTDSNSTKDTGLSNPENADSNLVKDTELPNTENTNSEKVDSKNTSSEVTTSSSIYTKDFSDGNLGTWENLVGNTDLKIENNKLNIHRNPEGGNNAIFIDTNSPELADGEAEFKFKINDYENKNGIGRFGFVLRGTSKDSWGFVGYDSNGKWLIESAKAWKDNIKGPTLETDKEYTMKVKFINNHITLLLDGKQVLDEDITLEGFPMDKGKIGFRAWFDEKNITVDDIKYGAPDSLPSEPVNPTIPDVKETDTIESENLIVTIDKNFPSICQYKHKETNAELYGQEDQLSKIIINGTEYTPEVKFTKKAYSAEYVLNIPAINVAITSEIKVDNDVVEFNITNIEENGDTKVSTFEIPDHNILSVKSTQIGANLAGACMYNKVEGSGDTFISLTDTLEEDSSPEGFMYAFLGTDKLNAGIWTNSLYDNPKGKFRRENYRVQKQTVKKGDYYRTGLWSGAWTYRAENMVDTEELPSIKISIANDMNNDSIVDWQDGAIAFRKIMNNPLGCENVPNTVVQRIAMNFASQATNPFLKTLDETKKTYLATDGLKQATILKGYGSEGHDSGHPDYGHIGERIGGPEDMNTLIESGKKYNAEFGVHVNATESYPEAMAFDETLINPKKPGWDWLDASFYIKTHDDATSGNRLKRFEELKNQVPGLAFIYLDVWYGDGWESKKIANEINSQGFRLATEFPNTLESDTTFSHWATDYKYGGKDMKGFNSNIVRFLRNHQKDTWIARNSLLGGTELTDFEGWQGRVDFNNMIKMTFNTNLPTKYMQNFPIIKWTDDTIKFENNVEVSTAKGTRVIKKDGITILNDDSYLIPWEPKTETKLYHWNAKGGDTTWTLPLSWKNLKNVKLYKLTDTGRELVDDLIVTNNEVTIKADASTPYVIDKGEEKPVIDVNWGEGTGLKDPGFESGNLSDWTVSGEGASVNRNKRGQYELTVEESDDVIVSQTITGLSKGTYSASVNVQVDGKRKATIGVKDYGGVEVSNYADSSFAGNYILADSKNETKMQRMRVFFDVPEGQTSATLYLKVASGKSKVTFDDIRVTKTKRPENPNNAYFTQDFENVPDGLYPFVKGPAGGTNDPRTHLSELHAPYTQKGWNGNAIDDVINGNWSLKAHKEASGLLLQTLPQTLRFEAGRNYRVSFKYENQKANAYSFIVGDGETELYKEPFEMITEPTNYNIEFTALESGDMWIGIKKLSGEADFVMDDLVVEDLGKGEFIPLPESKEPEVDPTFIPQSQMTAAATSEQEGSDEAANAIDGDEGTLWHTAWTITEETKLPQSLMLDLGGKYNINKVTVLPRQSGPNGKIKKYELYISTDGKNYTKVANGDWDTSEDLKVINFKTVEAAHIKLTALEGLGGWASLAEINVGKDLKINLINTIQKANNKLKEFEDLCTKEAKEVLQSEIKATQDTLNNEKSTDKDINNSDKKLNTAINNFIDSLKVDTTTSTALKVDESIELEKEFVVKCSLKNAKDITSEDLVITYNQDNLEFIEMSPAKDGIKILESDAMTNPGTIRVIMAQEGKENALNNDCDILDIKFKVKNKFESEIIKLHDVKLGNSDGVKIIATDSSINLNIFNLDINGDGIIDVGDLGIVAGCYDEETGSKNWNESADVDKDGKITIKDLMIIAKKILKIK